MFDKRGELVRLGPMYRVTKAGPDVPSYPAAQVGAIVVMHAKWTANQVPFGPVVLVEEPYWLGGERGALKWAGAVEPLHEVARLAADAMESNDARGEFPDQFPDLDAWLRQHAQGFALQMLASLCGVHPHELPDELVARVAAYALDGAVLALEEERGDAEG